jgi:hypothetical protein
MDSYPRIRIEINSQKCKGILLFAEAENAKKNPESDEIISVNEILFAVFF